MLKDESEHMVKFECKNPKCKHVQYEDRRVICSSGKGKVYRGDKDTIVVTCKKCGKHIEQEVDCNGYR